MDGKDSRRKYRKAEIEVRRIKRPRQSQRCQRCTTRSQLVFSPNHHLITTTNFQPAQCRTIGHILTTLFSRIHRVLTLNLVVGGNFPLAECAQSLRQRVCVFSCLRDGAHSKEDSWLGAYTETLATRCGLRAYSMARELPRRNALVSISPAFEIFAGTRMRMDMSQ
jgi:hypothetical protein